MRVTSQSTEREGETKPYSSAQVSDGVFHIPQVTMTLDCERDFLHSVEAEGGALPVISDREVARPKTRKVCSLREGGPLHLEVVKVFDLTPQAKVHIRSLHAKAAQSGQEVKPTQEVVKVVSPGASAVAVPGLPYTESQASRSSGSVEMIAV